MNVDFVALPAISGYVRSSSGAGVGGVAIRIVDCCGGVWAATTGPDGFYKSPYNLMLNRTYYVSVSDSGYTAQPAGNLAYLGNETPVTDRNFTVTPK